MADNSKNPQKDSFFKTYRGEFKKIIWPNRQQLTKQTITVIITSFLVGVFVFGLDWVFNVGFEILTNLVG